MPETTLVHGTCVAIGGQGVLILGQPGAGKSDLALRLIDQPGRGLNGVMRASLLVADDQVAVTRDGGELFASAPPAIAGLFEVRGLGIVPVEAVAQARLVLVVKITDAPAIDRMPDAANSRFEILGIGLPLTLVDAAKASAPARVRAALDRLGPG